MNHNPFYNESAQTQQQQHIEGVQILLPQPSTLHQVLPQPHLMPAPSSVPWDLNAMPWKVASNNAVQPGEVMQFSGGINPEDAARHRAKLMLHQKRKSDMVPSTPTKQFITEEIITAHFNGLHISSSHIQNSNSNVGFSSVDSTIDPHVLATSGKCFTNLTYRDYQITAKELEEKLKNANRITMCEEVKKFHEHNGPMMASFIPEALMHHIERPSTALVLWQPPPSPLLNIMQKQQEQDKLKKNKSTGMSVSDTDLIVEPEGDIDDFIDNNNTCSMDFNHPKPDGMDEDL